MNKSIEKIKSRRQQQQSHACTQTYTRIIYILWLLNVAKSRREASKNYKHCEKKPKQDRHFLTKKSK